MDDKYCPVIGLMTDSLLFTDRDVDLWLLIAVDRGNAVSRWDVFFFSSRRRHTRLTCDWSSDVCSSDLSRWLPRIKQHPPPDPRQPPRGGLAGGVRHARPPSCRTGPRAATAAPGPSRRRASQIGRASCRERA